jgi:hypothetical protein
VPVAALDAVELRDGQMGVDPEVAGIGKMAVEVAHSRLQAGLFGSSGPIVKMMVPGVWVDQKQLSTSG